jgi:hypothetical protein
MRYALALVLTTGVAHALTQPNGAQIPSPPGCSSGKPDGLAAVFACECTAAGVCNIGAPCPSQTSCDNGQHSTCETTLWHNFNDNTCLPSNLSGLDPVKDASVTPATFHPSCGLTFTLSTRGGARFQDIFGWYNVTGSAPSPSDLHVMLDCHATPGTKVVLDVKNDPAYKGGDIGFFLVTPEDHASKGSCAGGDCCATVPRVQNGQGWVYYSERQFNPDASGANPFIHLLVYDSKMSKTKFYFAWEDTNSASSNGFTDLVTSVDGVECGGGGADCDTGLKGQCAKGLSSCDQGVVTCIGLTQPAPEVCDGLDNDCNGTVDDGAVCPDMQVCVNGRCVPHCAQSAEFACANDLACDSATGVCVDPKCGNVTCGDGQVCRNGMCVGPCDGITCPHGTQCMKGACIDPCAQTKCPMGKVCKEGVCLNGCNQCGGIGCGALTCDAVSGACTDPSCSSCPAGTYCDNGSCHDSCDGAVCPPGQTCSMGGCVPINGSPGTGGGGGAIGGGGGGNGDQPGGGSSGCACGAMARPTGSGKTSSVLAFLLLGWLLRRRR